MIHFDILHQLTYRWSQFDKLPPINNNRKEANLIFDNGSKKNAHGGDFPE